MALCRLKWVECDIKLFIECRWGEGAGTKYLSKVEGSNDEVDEKKVKTTILGLSEISRGINHKLIANGGIEATRKR